MSADNALRIDHNGESFTVTEYFMSEGTGTHEIATAQTLFEAIRKANEYEEQLLRYGSYLEYGIRFTDRALKEAEKG